MLGRRKSRPSTPQDGAVAAPVRVDARTKHLVARIQPGEVAVIDHEDIDRLSAEGLIQKQVAAVVNASRSSTGRYPNLGPLLLCTAGIPVIDDAGPDVLEIPEGTKVVIDEGKISTITSGHTVTVATGRLLDVATVEKALDVAKQSISHELERFAENTIEYIKDERDILLEAAPLPDIKTGLHHRHVLIVVRGYEYKADLAALRAYVREMRPVLIGVDGGADALIDNGLRPDMIVGDMDSVTNEALLCGAELVVHAYPGGEAPGLERLQALGLECAIYESMGTSEDIAMLLAFERGAELIVAVGTHASFVEFMDKGRKGMASTFLTRLRVGPILVDAKGVSRLYHSHIRRLDLFVLLAGALATMALVIVLSKPLRLYAVLVWQQVRDLWFSIVDSIF